MRLSPSAHRDTFCRDNLPPAHLWPDLRPLDHPERLNCAEVLLDRTARRLGPDRPCLLGGGQRWTYGDVRERVNRLAHVLTDHFGLVPGNRVLLRGPNTPWLAVCWLAVVKAGGVVVATMPLLRTGELQTVCDTAKPFLALCDDRFTEALEPLRDNLTVVGQDELDRLCAAAPTDYTAVDTAADDVVLLGFTSGTTGRPKATMHFHRDVLAIADTFSAHIVRPRPDDLFTGTPPLAFTFGLGGLLVFPLRAGAAPLLLERQTPVELAETAHANGVTVLFTAPTVYRAILAAGKADLLRGVRRCVSAGEALPAQVSEDFHAATGTRIIDGIGATEMLHVFISAADDEVRPGATGRVVPGYEAAVLDEHGHPAPDGVAGRLAVRGPTGCRYLADERQAAYVHNGWNITGDTYVRDADGYFWYQARNDDMIISAGYNIAGPEVEAALSRHPRVVDCGVVAAPDAERGWIVKAYVIADGVTAADLQDFVKATIAPYKYPRAVEFVTALPRTDTGKLQRFRLREWAAAGTPVDVLSPATDRSTAGRRPVPGSPGRR
ncbi:AMP-binding protein [Saccharothrix mutabilis subsp. mutabilis]|uniref:AMP-binding protein n=1 Tax=Saccharothrix mutabilis subsp. mutabilis TaxID=66855 RepID=A0ABN0TJU5_9PSEU